MNIEQLRQIKARNEDALLAIPGVTAVDLAEDRLIVFVASLPGPGVPTEVEGVPVELREMTPELQGDGS